MGKVSVKIMDFVVSNFTSDVGVKDELRYTASFASAAGKVASYGRIEKEINGFHDSVNGELISVTPVPVVTRRNNNARNDTVHMNYTIVYRTAGESPQGKMVCRRCGAAVCRETDRDLKKEYPYYCPCCDENMYSFECVIEGYTGDE